MTFLVGWWYSLTVTLQSLKLMRLALGWNQWNMCSIIFFLNTLNTRAFCTWELEYIFNNSKQTQNPFTSAALFYVLAVSIKRKSIVKFTLRVWVTKVDQQICHYVLMSPALDPVLKTHIPVWAVLVVKWSSGQRARIHLWQPEFESHWSLQFWKKNCRHEVYKNRPIWSHWVLC